MKVKRPFFLFIFFIFLVSAPAAAQEDNSTKNVVVELDEATWISDINWNPENSSGSIKVQIYSEIPKQISIQEVPDYSGKSGEFQPAQQRTLNVGMNTITVPVNGRTNFGVALADQNDGAYYNRDGGGELPEAQGIQVLIFMGVSIMFYEGFYIIRARIRNSLIAIKPQRDL